MFVCCTGMARSGSTWSFNVCRELLEATGEPLIAGYYGEGEALDDFIESRGLEAFPGHVLLKLHQPADRLLGMICDGRARNVFTLRDPRDCLRSRMDFEGKPFDDALMGVAGNLIMYNLYAGATDTLFVRYEAMAADPAAEVRRIAGHLGLAPVEDEVGRIAEATGISAARRKVEDLAGRTDAGTVEIAGRRVDTETCLQTGHIRDGRAGG
ncbi:MAG: sulfotransferase, partial [Rhodospirillaceae bacterium]|nr:sulfotransferase [Rhodospirillaceae bacterium]